MHRFTTKKCNYPSWLKSDLEIVYYTCSVQHLPHPIRYTHSAKGFHSFMLYLYDIVTGIHYITLKSGYGDRDFVFVSLLLESHRPYNLQRLSSSIFFLSL